MRADISAAFGRLHAYGIPGFVHVCLCLCLFLYLCLCLCTCTCACASVPRRVRQARSLMSRASRNKGTRTACISPCTAPHNVQPPHRAP